MKTKELAKKRIMFIQKEDYNFLTYNLLILLNALDCSNESKRFKDFRKIAYLIEFINSGADIEKYSKFELANIYSKSQLRKQLLSHLLIVLRNHNFIDISINRTHNSFDIWLKKENIPSDFFDQDLFKSELNNIKELKQRITALKVTTVKTLVDKVFSSHNIITWEI